MYLECLGLVGIAQNIKNLLANSMNGWRTELTSNGQSLGSVDIKRGIFQGDSLSPLLFVITMIPLTLILRKCEVGYSYGNNIKRRCFREAYTGLPVARVTENQKALNCVVLKYSIPVSEE